jgi:peptidoglycan/xylan/chitin deacetylase (PgdA/CDA1 family)
MKAQLAELVGSEAVTRVAVTVTGRRLRILAYHDVPSAAAFEAQLVHLSERYRPISGGQVAAAFAGGPALPDRAVWLTFDDGFPAVVDVAQPLLERYATTATMFVCPSVVDTAEPFWWEVVREARRAGLTTGHDPIPGATERRLKTLGDEQRRTVVRDLSDRLQAHAGSPFRRPQLTSEQLRTWVDAGHELGNHTWDHPLLDRCSEDDQRRQVGQAHDWLLDAAGVRSRTFAYPNGNWSAATERALDDLGYVTAVGFDHHLVPLGAHPMRLSRLRVDADAPSSRLRAIASGAHSGAFAARQRLGRSAPPTGDPRHLPR